mmetsp:Transcript_26244/g.62080  ORF Transcript_26244/g.62080 Transcript_26244/m.62080 type:complete len:320 (-) Transcript_26244:336-1295(-)
MTPRRLKPPWPRCAPPACRSKTWRSAAPTWKTCSSTSCKETRHERRLHPVQEGSAALLEGQLPDRGGAGAHRLHVPVGLRAHAGGSRQGLRLGQLHPLPDPGPRDDERAAERVRQQLVQPDPEQDHRQPGLPAADAAVAPGLVRGLCGRGHRARRGRGPGCAAGDGLVRAAGPGQPAVGAGVHRARCRADGHAGPDRRAVGREVRPARRLPELHHHADDLPVRRFLLGALAARVLAGREPSEPVLLHDRRLPARLLRRQRRVALAELRRGGEQLRGYRRAGPLAAPARLQDPFLNLGLQGAEGRRLEPFLESRVFQKDP